MLFWAHPLMKLQISFSITYAYTKTRKSNLNFTCRSFVPRHFLCSDKPRCWLRRRDCYWEIPRRHRRRVDTRNLKSRKSSADTCQVVIDGYKSFHFVCSAEFIDECMHVIINECKNKWVHVYRINDGIFARKDEWIHGRVNECMHVTNWVHANEWMKHASLNVNDWMDGCMHACMHGSVNECMQVWINQSMHVLTISDTSLTCLSHLSPPTPCLQAHRPKSSHWRLVDPTWLQ